MIVAGLDEVGRGSIAGPLLVVAAAFEIPEWRWANADSRSYRTAETPCPTSGVKDSKAYSSRKRREDSAAAIETGEAFVGRGQGIVTSYDLTVRGMSWALQAAFARALTSLPIVPDLVLVDGDIHIPSWSGTQHCRPKADVHWWPVSAASVLAKVARDRWMETLDGSYPGYGWAVNAGYGTKDHFSAIRKNGITPVHRFNFIRSRIPDSLSQETAESA